MTTNYDENISLLESGKLFTETDSKVIDIIKKTCSSLSDNQNIVVRIVGGWVRDKILGLSNDDIDITVNGISCLDFAKKISENENAKYVFLEANHEQSKHVDTARVCLFKDFWLDICNLRPDHFTKDGKPVDEATELSDARRRDFSMNALFFNLNEMKVEDFVNGVDSIKRKVIITPISPEEDFSDDPLRIIRCFRFVSKFDFDIDPSIIAAIPKIIPLFLSNITKDRIATELTKLFHSDHYFKALHLLIETGMLQPVFDPENDYHLDNAKTLQKIEKINSINPNINEEDRMIVYFASIYSDLIDANKRPDPSKKNKSTFALEYMILRVLRLTNDLYNNVNHILEGKKYIYNLFNENKEISRLNAGTFVRIVGAKWELCKYLLEEDSILNYFNNILYPFIIDQNLSKAYQLKQLIDGKTLAQLRNIPPGPLLKQYIQEMINWQLENPTGTAEDYKNFLASNN